MLNHGWLESTDAVRGVERDRGGNATEMRPRALIGPATSASPADGSVVAKHAFSDSGAAWAEASVGEVGRAPLGGGLSRRRAHEDGPELSQEHVRSWDLALAILNQSDPDPDFLGRPEPSVSGSGRGFCCSGGLERGGRRWPRLARSSLCFLGGASFRLLRSAFLFGSSGTSTLSWTGYRQVVQCSDGPSELMSPALLPPILYESISLNRVGLLLKEEVKGKHVGFAGL